jgi:L-seryl-tRNA(Ser) seleniumtransferase
MTFYREMGVRAGINARGFNTVLGGSILPPDVADAMSEANDQFVVMSEILAKSGEYVARFLGSEAAYITPGAAAGLILSSAAVMAGTDRQKMGQLPDTTGMKNEIVFQRAQMYSYARCLTVVGARLVLVGDEKGCTTAQVEAAIGPRTAALAYFESSDWGPRVVPLAEMRRLATAHSVPLILDAASRIYPLDYFRRMAQTGDLTCFGAKYIQAPNSTGIVAGRRDLVQAVAANAFINFEEAGAEGAPLPIGRGFKVDRQEIVAVAAAVKRWFTIDHEQRLATFDARMHVIQQGLKRIRGVAASAPKAPPVGPDVSLTVTVDPKTAGKTAAQVAAELRDGDPPIWIRQTGDDLFVHVPTLNDGEEKIVLDRLKAALSTRRSTAA